VTLTRDLNTAIVIKERMDEDTLLLEVGFGEVF
jgi:hypothetical protein